jgi:hypothetical protein
VLCAAWILLCVTAIPLLAAAMAATALMCNLGACIQFSLAGCFPVSSRVHWACFCVKAGLVRGCNAMEAGSSARNMIMKKDMQPFDDREEGLFPAEFGLWLQYRRAGGT